MKDFSLLFDEFCGVCGNCCNGIQPGFIITFPEDVFRLAQYFQIPINHVLERYCISAEVDFSDLEIEDISLPSENNIPTYVFDFDPTGPCRFYDKQSKHCSIYSARPQQCQKFPFIYSSFASQENFEFISETCPVFQTWINQNSQDCSEPIKFSKIEGKVRLQFEELQREEKKFLQNYLKSLKKNHNSLKLTYKSYN